MARKKSTERDRKARVRRLYLNDGLDAVEIADRLLESGHLACSVRRARATVRSDIASLKSDLESTRAEQDAADLKQFAVEQLAADGVPESLIRRYERLRFAWHRAVEIMEDSSTITTHWTSDAGNGGSSTRPRWSASAKASAIVEMRQLAKELGAIEREIEEIRGRGKENEGDEVREGRLVIVMGDESVEDLIEANNLREVN